MGLIDLKNKLFCDKKVSDSNASFTGIIKSIFNAAEEKLGNLWKKVPTFSDITAKLNVISDNIKKDAKEAKEAFIKNANEVLDSNIEAAKEEFNAIDKALKTVKTTLGEIFTCPLAENNDPQSPKVNPISEVLSSPSTNDTTLINISSDTKIKKNLEDAKTQSLSKTAEAITKANNELTNKGVLEIRETVKTLSNPHPILNNYVKQLKYFQPISENVGESFFGYTPDKPSLQLADWNSSIPKAIRTSSNAKIRKDVASEVSKAYTNLNARFVSNISNEFYFERRATTFSSAHSFHIAGDSLFPVDHIVSKDSILMGGLAIILTNTIGDQITQINYLVPIDPNYSIEKDYYTTEVENKTIVIDKRNNIIRKPFETVNNDALKPKDLAEV